MGISETNRKADYRGWHVSRTVVTGYKFLHFVSEFQHLSQWGATWEQVTLLRADLGTEKPFKVATIKRKWQGVEERAQW